MKRYFTLLPQPWIIIMIVFTVIRPAYADHVPAKEDETGGEAVVRIFAGGESLSILGEAKGGYLDGDGRRYGSLTAGPYIRLFDNLKAGAFYRFQQGERHDDDWVALNPGWEWKDTASRNEHVLIGDLTPRLLAGFLPGKNWVLELKSRYLNNLTNDERTITVRPGLMFVLFRGGEPFMNFFLQYELYFPLNYSDELIYERWAYAGVIFHINETLQAGLYGAYQTVTWGPSDDFERLHPGESYKVESEYLIAGVMVIMRLKM